MEIALVASKFPPIVGGGETYIYNLAQQFVQNGHSVTIVTDEQVKLMGVKNTSFKYLFIKDFESVCVGSSPFVTAVSELHEALTMKKFDIIHIHNLIPLYLVNQFASKINSQIIFTFHNTPNPPERIMGYYKDFNLDYSFASQIIKLCKYDLLVEGSKFYREWAIKLGSLPEKTKLVYLGIDRSVFSPEKYDQKKSRNLLGISDTDRIITIPSRIIPRKGIAESVKALKALKANNHNLKVKLFLPAMFEPFNPKYSEEIKNLISELDLNNDVITPKFHIPYDSMPLVYSSSDIVIMPSYYEGLGLGLLEAMSMKVPVIGANTFGINEYLINSDNGLTVEVGDVEGLASSINRLLNDSALRERLIYNAAQTVSCSFDIEKQARQIIECYKSLYG